MGLLQRPYLGYSTRSFSRRPADEKPAAPLLSSPVSWSVVAGGPTGPQESPRSAQHSVCTS